MVLEKSPIVLDNPFLRYLSYNLLDIYKNKKIHLEIGFGNGQYIADFAMVKKDEIFFGIEYSKKYFEKAVKRVERYNLSNVKLIFGEALSIISQLFPDKFFDIVHINFPDPWPKKRHRDRRLINADFAIEVRRILKKNGEIFFASDFEEYFINSVSIFENAKLKPIFLSNIPNQERVAKTKYEYEFMASGKKIFYSVLKKS